MHVDGFEGWLGNEIYSVAGQGLLIKNSMTQQSNGAILIPKFTNTQGNSLIRYSLTLNVPEFSEVVTGVDWMYTYLLHSNGEVAPYGYNTPGTCFTNSFVENEDKTYDWTVEMPEGKAMINTADGMRELGEYDIDHVSVFIQSALNSNILVKNVKVTGLVPKLAAPANGRFENFTGSEARVSWDAVPEADDYVVRIYRNARCSGIDYDLGAYEQIRTAETSVDIADLNTDMSATIVEVFAIGKGTRSRNTRIRIMEHATPEFEITETADGKLYMKWDVPRTNVVTMVNLLKGDKLEAADDNYVVAKLSTEDMKDSQPTSSNIYFNGQEGSWLAYADALEIKDGAMVNNNGLGQNKLTVMSNTAYDFSEATGKVRVKVNAKTDGHCLMKVAFVDQDEESLFLVAKAYEYVTLSNEFDTYEVELPALERARVEITFGGTDNVYFKGLEINCALPAGTLFFKPAQSINVATFGTTMGEVKFDMPEGPFTNLKVWGMNARYEYYDASTPARSVYSAYGVPAYVEKEASGVEEIVIDNNNAEIPVYYNLQGIRVDNPSNGVFLKVTGGKTEKVLAK